ncbi:MAG: hypothetical protein U0169_06670 [Polyangiaceae bacterium]
MNPRVSSRIRKAFVAAACVSVAFTGLMGFLHTKTGRPYLRYLPHSMAMGTCPLGVRSDLTAADREEARNGALPRAGRAASTRPALGFRLDATSRGDVALWQMRAGVTCTEGTSGVSATCDDVPDAALAELGVPVRAGSADANSLTFRFDEHDKLVAVLRTSERSVADEAIDAHALAFADVAKTAGPETDRAGEWTSDYLASGALHQVRAEFHFSNYYASLSATNMGARYVVTQEFQSIRN